jgi:subtilisin family serine protease
MIDSKREPIKSALKYDAFWHLQAIGLLPVLDNPLPPTAERPDSPIWTELGDASALVAIIDTGVSDHPYLYQRLQPSTNIDLTGEPTLKLPEIKAAAGTFAGLNTDLLTKLGLRSKSQKPFESVLEKLCVEYEPRRPFDFGAPSAANQKFAAHGTSCAGLIAASSKHRPAESSADRPYYRGVDPGSKVMSITTSFSPHPEMLTLAFLLAAKKPADVILFPRGLPREISLADALSDPKMAAKMTNEEKEAALPWLALKETILAVSRLIPVICAAGNECDDAAIAPACFAAEDNGIIGVAAMNYFGVRSSYSNFGRGISITAPSDDAEMFNRIQARLDKTDRFYGEYPYPAFIANFAVDEIRYGEAAIRAIDVPGPFGFSDTARNTGSKDEADVEARLATEPESFFTDFGGTSGAASIVAGVASLMQRAAKLRKGSDNVVRGKTLGGKRLRELMTANVRKANDALPHLANFVDVGIPPVTKRLATDRVNGDEPLDFVEAFGAGLVAADLAVAAAFAEPL